MRPLIDCESCGGPMPAGKRCPHCAARPTADSLRRLVLRFALLGAAACGTTMTAVAAYGIAIVNCQQEGSTVGSFCESGGLSGSCNDGGVCLPTDPCQGHAQGQVCVCSGTQICSCSDAGVCAPAN